MITGFLPREDYLSLLKSADLYIDSFYPSDGRGGQAFGQALLEAMADGVPTIVADRPTLHLSPEWYHGEIFKGGNHVELADKIVALIENGAKYNIIRENNLASVKNYFDWNKNMDIIERELYLRWQQ